MRKLRETKRAETLADRARSELKAAIMSGHFHPGEKITIRQVAVALNISITPAREALFNLATEGALDSTDSRSVTIPALDVKRVKELMKLRVVLESLASREAAKNLEKAGIEELRQVHEKLVAANTARDYASVIRLNWEFHFTLYEYARMPTLLKMIESCWLQMGSYSNIIYPAYGEISSGLDNHEAILAAATKGKPDDLAAAVARDIKFAGRALLANLAAAAGRAGSWNRVASTTRRVAVGE